MKVCFRCNKAQPLTEYYVHAQMADGHLNKCKSCTKADAKARLEVKIKDPEWADAERERGRLKHYRLGYREKYRPTSEEKAKITANYKAKYPEKAVAHAACSKMVAKVKGNHLHHWSYRIEHNRDLIEIPAEKHYTLHRFIKYDQQYMMYRTKDGQLLDTKDKHIAYLNSLPF